MQHQSSIIDDDQSMDQAAGANMATGGAQNLQMQQSQTSNGIAADGTQLGGDN